jgi:hypothetical protein
LAKNTWVAVLLNLFLYGLGYVYLGKRKAFGATLFIAQIAFWAAEGYALSSHLPFGPVTNTYVEFDSVGFGILGLAFAYDAYRIAEESHYEKASASHSMRPIFWGLIFVLIGVILVFITGGPIARVPVGTSPIWEYALLALGVLLAAFSIPIALVGEFISWRKKRKSNT